MNKPFRKPLTRRWVRTLVVTVPAAALLLYVMLRSGVTTEQGADASVSASVSSPVSVAAGLPAAAGTGVAVDAGQVSLEDVRLAEELLQTHGERIGDPVVQVSLLTIRERLVRESGEALGAKRFAGIIKLAFPDFEVAILQRIALMMEYRDWLLAAQSELNGLDTLQRSSRLWGQRYALFNEEAELIWAHERQQADQKASNMQAVILDLNTDRTTSLDEKIYQLETAIDETYGAIKSSMLISPAQTAQVFFDLDSVQETLQAMEPEARAKEIAKARLSLGFTEEQAARLAQEDERKEARWNQGYDYMARKAEIDVRLQGEAQSEAVSQLRETIFGANSVTIAREEEAGFFRFERPRLYGRN